jgi:5'(3')-deoxyribonucleotidase
MERENTITSPYHKDINHSYIKRHNHFYKKLACATRKQRNLYIKGASEDELDSLGQCAYWILKEKIPLSSRQTIRLVEHKEVVRELSLGKRGVRRLLLNQGFFIPFLANAVVNKFFMKKHKKVPTITDNTILDNQTEKVKHNGLQ